MKADQIQNHISKIKDKGAMCIFIETGAGSVVYNELCKYPNTASKVVYYAESPNNWEYNKEKYMHGDDVRAVSVEVCANLIRFHHNNENAHYPILVSTVQIANDENTCSHGWFGFSFNSNQVFFHYTIRGNKTREEQLQIIALIGLDILASLGNPTEISNGYIDQIVGSNSPIRDLVTTMFNGMDNNDSNHCMIISKTGEIMRLEEYLRQNKNINVFKGSFNPLHPEHIEIANTMENTLMCISLHNRDINKSSNIDNMMKRIRLLHSYRYDIMIDTKGYYSDSYNLITSSTSFTELHKLNYLIGSDTMRRLLNDTVNDHGDNAVEAFHKLYNKATFHNFQRTGDVVLKVTGYDNILNYDIDTIGISSTTIRIHIENGTLESLSGDNENHLIDDEYITNLLKYFS